MKVFLLSIIGQAFFNLILIFYIFCATRRGSIWRKIGIIGVAIEYLTTVVVFYLRNKMPLGYVSNAIEVLNNYYLALFMMLFWLTIIYVILAIIGYIWRRRGGEKQIVKREIKKWNGRAFLLMIPITIIMCTVGYFNTMRPSTTHYTIHLPAKAGINSLRVALITDVHIGEIIEPKQIAHLRSMVNAQDPDYVLLGGDIMDYYTAPAYREGIVENMSKLHQDKGHIFYTLGNHEYYYNLEEKEEWMRNVGTLLKDSVVQLASNLYLIGRDDYTNENRAALSQLKSQVPSGAVTILLDHQPNKPNEVREAGIDLALHGHTHNGQFIPFKWVTRLKFERSYGLYEKGGTIFCISSGYGVAGTPFRVGTHSEIVILHLIFDK